MKVISTYSLDSNFTINSGEYPQSRNTIVNIDSPDFERLVLCSIIVRWTVNSLQDWSADMDTINKSAEAWKTQHNRLVEKFNNLVEKNGKYDFDGYQLALNEDAVLVNRGDGVAMRADCLAFNQVTYEWSEGCIYWEIEENQLPEDVDYSDASIVELDLDPESSDPADLETL